MTKLHKLAAGAAAAALLIGGQAIAAGMPDNPSDDAAADGSWQVTAEVLVALGAVAGASYWVSHSDSSTSP